MLSDEVIDKVVERLVNRIENGNTYVLEQIGKSIKKIGTLSPSKAQQLVQILRYGGDYDKIIRELSKITKLNVADIQKIFKEVAKNDYMFAKQFYEYRNIKFIPFDENLQLQRQINALSEMAIKDYINLTRTSALGFSTQSLDENGKLKTVFKDLSQTYIDTLDSAVFNVSQGKTTFDEEMSKIIKELGTSGLKVVDFKSGRTMRMDSAVRMQLKDALRTLHNEEQKMFGEGFDADGVEISVHEYPAPDHELVQGRQFSNEEFDKFQNDQDAISYDGIEFPAISEETGRDRRAISQYNCYHYIFVIVLGVSKPQYSNEQLQNIINRNDKGFDFEGKHYSMYQGTQLQRQIETEIRKQKDIQIMARAGNNEKALNESQAKINQLTQKYKELNDASGLKAKTDRLRVSGYHKIRANQKEIDYARKNNIIWHSTNNLKAIINDNKIIKPSIAVAKELNSKVKYGTQFIEFKPEILENVNKNVVLYNGDGGNQYSKNNKHFENLMQALENKPKYYNELKFNNNLEFLKYVKKVYIRQDEAKSIIDLLKKNKIDYEIYSDYRSK